jgi:hypothetical protein
METHLWVSTISNAIIAGAYLSVAGALRKLFVRRDLPKTRLLLIFVPVFAMCGLGHIGNIADAWAGHHTQFSFYVHAIQSLFALPAGVIIWPIMAYFGRLPTLLEHEVLVDRLSRQTGEIDLIKSQLIEKIKGG